MKHFDLDLEFVFDRALGAEELGTLQRLLSELAPSWIQSLHVWMHRNDQRAVDARAAGSLAEEVFAAAGWRGETYRRLVAEHGPGDERFFGSAELRGSSAALTVVIGLDSKPLFRMRDGRRLLGNRIAFQLRATRFEGIGSADWAKRMLEGLASSLRPAWGAAYSGSEYERKVMSDVPPLRAEGRDFSEYLPGLFWLNYFGEPYVEFIGLDRLLSVPTLARGVGEGVVVELSGGPSAWEDGDYRNSEDAVLDHLGREFFFSKHDRDQATRAPRWPS